MIYFHQYICTYTILYYTYLRMYFSIFFAIKFFKNILYVQKVIRSDVIRSVFLYVQTLYVRYLYTFRFIRSDVIRSDVIRSVFIRSDVIRSDVIRSVIIRSVGESGNLGWTPSLRKISVFVLERDTRTKASDSTETPAIEKKTPTPSILGYKI